jgi:hypothetical protein
MVKSKEAIGLMNRLFKTKRRNRSKPLHLRGSKTLGAKSPHKGNRGKY